MTDTLISTYLSSLAWPATVLFVLLVLRAQLQDILLALVRRLDAGSEVSCPWFTFGAVVRLPGAQATEKITAAHLALVHSCWRYAKKDHEFRSRMYCFHVIVQCTDSVLARIESVEYHLDAAYPNPVRIVADRSTKFKLKELANGESQLRAVITIRDQEEKIELTRYINLTENGPKI